MKPKIQTSRNPLQQFCNRIEEQNHAKEARNNENIYPFLYQQCAVQKHCIYYKTVCTKKYELTLSIRDNCVTLQDKSVLYIEKIFRNNDTSEVFIVGKKFTELQSFFKTPCCLKLFNILVAQNLSNSLSTVNLNKVQEKCLKFSYNDGFIIMPLLHTQD